jgi:hypothetical protein
MCHLDWLPSRKYGTVWYHPTSSKLWYLTALSFVNFQEKLTGTSFTLCACEASFVRLAVCLALMHFLRQQHVLKDAKKRLGVVYTKHKGFKQEFNSLITYEVRVDKFESAWQKLSSTIWLKTNSCDDFTNTGRNGQIPTS